LIVVNLRPRRLTYLAAMKIRGVAFASSILVATPALAQPAPAGAAPTAMPAPAVAPPAPLTSAGAGSPPEPPVPDHGPPPKPWFVHESFGFNVVTYTAANGAAAASTVTPDKKAIIFEQVGFGYWPHPNVRVQLTGMFGETLTGLKPGASKFTLAAFIPAAFYTNGGVFAGGGPLIAPRAFGQNGANIGIYTAGGYAFTVGGGVSLALAVQIPVMIATQISVGVTPAIVLGERF
jgi:hypothetical protein